MMEAAQIHADRSDSERITAMLNGYVITQLVAAAVRLGIADHLAGGDMTDLDLAEATGVRRAELRRYLRALHALGFVQSVSPTRYRGTTLSDLLRRDVLDSRHGQALMAGAEYYGAWSELDYSLRTGESAFERRHGSSLWTHLADNDEAAAAFARTMRWNTGHVLHDVLNLYDFSTIELVADIGAGDGTLVAALLVRYPRLRAIAVELPSVIDGTRQTLEARGVADRCELVTGDFLTSVPSGADLYLLKAVIHNWNDDLALRILQNCRTAADNGRLLLIERPMDSDDLLGGALRDLTMLVLFGGQDRTIQEYRSLLHRAGLVVSRMTVGPSGVCLLEAIGAKLP
jgi:orsellinic acid C2-O-methyltransferase